MRLALVLVLLVSSAAFADQDYCNRNDGKTEGAVAGAVLGGGAGVLMHGKVAGGLLGAGLGALAGGLIGHDQDVKHDIRDCGEDAAPVQRQEARDDAREAADEQRQEDIAYDREASRQRFEASRYAPPPPPYTCDLLRHGYALIYHPYGHQLVRIYGGDRYNCMRAAFRANRGLPY